MQSYLDRESCNLWDILCDGEYFKADFQLKIIFLKADKMLQLVAYKRIMSNWRSLKGSWYLYHSTLLDCRYWSYFYRIGFKRLMKKFYKIEPGLLLSFQWILNRYRNDNRFIMRTSGKSDNITRWSSRCQKGRDLHWRFYRRYVNPSAHISDEDG